MLAKKWFCTQAKRRQFNVHWGRLHDGFAKESHIVFFCLFSRRWKNLEIDDCWLNFPVCCMHAKWQRNNKRKWHLTDINLVNVQREHFSAIDNEGPLENRERENFKPDLVSCENIFVFFLQWQMDTNQWQETRLLIFAISKRPSLPRTVFFHSDHQLII